MDQPELSRHCIPWTPFKGSLGDSTVCIVSSAGVRRKTDPPFNTDGDSTFRVIEGAGSDLAFDDSHYDHACADRDINCIFPIDRLAEMKADGTIKGPTAKHFSYGFSMKLRELRDDTFPKLLKEIEAARPDIVVLTGGWGLCHRTVVTVQRLIELRGIATVLITVDPEQSAQANPPRALHPRPFVPGHSLGRPNDPALQKRILGDALALVRDAKEPGKIVSRDYGGWKRDRIASSSMGWTKRSVRLNASLLGHHSGGRNLFVWWPFGCFVCLCARQNDPLETMEHMVAPKGTSRSKCSCPTCRLSGDQTLEMEKFSVQDFLSSRRPVLELCAVPLSAHR